MAKKQATDHEAEIAVVDQAAQEQAAAEHTQAVQEGAAGTQPYGADNPAPGAANYEPPELNPKPGTDEWLAQNPGAITSGSVKA